jgi:hypothetical protein
MDALSPADALTLDERNRRHVDRAHMEPAEQALLQTLVDRLGGGRLLVWAAASPPDCECALGAER